MSRNLKVWILEIIYTCLFTQTSITWLFHYFCNYLQCSKCNICICMPQAIFSSLKNCTGVDLVCFSVASCSESLRRGWSGRWGVVRCLACQSISSSPSILCRHFILLRVIGRLELIQAVMGQEAGYTPMRLASPSQQTHKIEESAHEHVVPRRHRSTKHACF